MPVECNKCCGQEAGAASQTTDNKRFDSDDKKINVGDADDASQMKCENNGITTNTTTAAAANTETNVGHNDNGDANRQPLKPVDHVIFDLDGLLIDSEACFANAIAILLKRFGIEEYSKDLQEKVLGMEVARGIEVIIKTTGLPLTVEQFMQMEREIYKEEMLKVKLMPGVVRLLEHLKQNNIPMAIATGSTNESFVIKTQRHQQLFELGKYFQHIVFTRDDPEVKNPKPAPDVYLVTASRFPTKPKPEQCLVFEDSSIGVDGAIAAGMQCIMVPDVRFECKQKNATLILPSLEQFQPEMFGLPPFSDSKQTENESAKSPSDSN